MQPCKGEEKIICSNRKVKDKTICEANITHRAQATGMFMQGIVGYLTFLHRHVSHKHQLAVTLRQHHAEAAETHGGQTVNL